MYLVNTIVEYCLYYVELCIVEYDKVRCYKTTLTDRTVRSGELASDCGIAVKCNVCFKWYLDLD